ncbi:MAG: RdgB/HAM1 family non-canonical purine NTP pyrophosphatase [Alphaproteobacteria bacterium]
MAVAVSLRARDLVLATHNRGKLLEFARLLAPLGARISSAADLGLPEPEETGTSFEANAELKARATMAACGKVALADDSGLAVDALGGDPGVYSARWAGPERDFSMAMQRIETALQSADNRRASFVTVLALCWPEGGVEFFRGTIAGTLIWPPRGAAGFGYDPMFVPDGQTLTFGAMTPEQKAAISHRALACAELVRRYG